MADHAVERLGGKTLLQYANTPYMDMLARMGRTGRLITIPDGFQPGSEVANAAILGYDLNEVYEGRGPLEAASIGYEMQPGDFALRCNIINVQNGLIITHNPLDRRCRTTHRVSERKAFKRSGNRQPLWQEPCSFHQGHSVSTSTRCQQRQ